jgi:long-subunit acyl-CoA synthetase (AMP-forming)
MASVRPSLEPRSELESLKEKAAETSPTTHYCPLAHPQPGSIGHLLPNIDARIVDPVTFKDVKDGEEGELWIRGPNVMLGYVNRPDATAEAIVEGDWLRTGDVAYVRDNFFFITCVVTVLPS